MTILSELPSEHPLRNTALAEIKAQYRFENANVWRTVKPSWGIAKATFNRLGEVWTKGTVWRVTDYG